MPFDPIGRVRRWNDHWRPIVPIFVAEFMAVVGFGALLPVLPLYVTEQGVDPATLGVILAAWPAARLVFEPIFGWLADRTSRRALMLGGLVVLTIGTLLPLAFHGPIELFILRFVSGLGVSMYDPAARGTIVEETEEDERGEAFGLYSVGADGRLHLRPGHRSGRGGGGRVVRLRLRGGGRRLHRGRHLSRPRLPPARPIGSGRPTPRPAGRPRSRAHTRSTAPIPRRSRSA